MLIACQDKHGVPVITAPIVMKASTANMGEETAAGEWTPVRRFVKSRQARQMAMARPFFRIGGQLLAYCIIGNAVCEV